METNKSSRCHSNTSSTITNLSETFASVTMVVLSSNSITTVNFIQPIASLSPFKLPQQQFLPLSDSPSSKSLSLSSSSPTRPSRLSLVPRVSSSSFSSGFSSDDVGDVLGDVTIFRANGDLVSFKDLWDQHEGMAVVALLRHFGCPCCWELASTLKELKPRFDAAGVKLIAVGVGNANKAHILAERLPFPMDCLYADPTRKAYDVLGLYHGFGRTFFNPASAKVFTRFDSLQKAVKNYTIEATPDDRSGVLQQGGMFVFKGKELLYARKDEGTGDHAPLDDVLNVCCKIPAA